MAERIVIKQDVCVGCGVCTSFCPVDALDGWGTVKVDQDKCMMCLDCVGTCPVDALEVQA